MQKVIRVLAFESSCDDTAVALLAGSREDEVPRLVSHSVQSQNDVHQKFGGVVPELASRAHLENLVPCLHKVMEEAKISFEDVDAFAATARPGLVGSLLVGHTAAKLLSLIFKKPFISCDHLESHLSSVFLSQAPQFPFLSLLVSGGHTSLFLVKSYDEFQELGVTLDDAAGEAFDKAARILGLGFPGGPEIEKLAREGSADAVKFPRVKTPGLQMSFSGLKSEFGREFTRGTSKKEDMAASFQRAIFDEILDRVLRATDQTQCRRLAIVGGVARNMSLRSRLDRLVQENRLESWMAPALEFCTDNAAMVGVSAFRKFRNLNLSNLEDDVFSTSRPKPRHAA